MEFSKFINLKKKLPGTEIEIAVPSGDKTIELIIKKIKQYLPYIKKITIQLNNFVEANRKFANGILTLKANNNTLSVLEFVAPNDISKDKYNWQRYSYDLYNGVAFLSSFCFDENIVSYNGNQNIRELIFNNLCFVQQDRTLKFLNIFNNLTEIKIKNNGKLNLGHIPYFFKFKLDKLEKLHIESNSINKFDIKKMYSSIINNLNNTPKLCDFKLIIDKKDIFKKDGSTHAELIKNKLIENSGTGVNDLICDIENLFVTETQLQLLNATLKLKKKILCPQLKEILKNTQDEIKLKFKCFKILAEKLLNNGYFNQAIKIGSLFERYPGYATTAYDIFYSIPKKHKDYMIALYKIMMLMPNLNKIYDKDALTNKKMIIEADKNKKLMIRIYYGVDIIIFYSKNKKKDLVDSQKQLFDNNFKSIVKLTECLLHEAFTGKPTMTGKNCIFKSKLYNFESGKGITSGKELTEIILDVIKKLKNYKKTDNTSRNLILMKNYKTNSNDIQVYKDENTPKNLGVKNNNIISNI